MSVAYHRSPIKKVDYNKVNAGKTLPDQTMSIKEIVSRFTRGISVNAHERPGVYSTQDEYDLEKLNRLEFGEKQAMAHSLAKLVEDTANELDEQEKEAAAAAKEKAKADLTPVIPVQKAPETPKA